MWQTETQQTQKHHSRQIIILEMRSRFAPIQNTQGEMLDKEATNYKEKETLQHRHQTPVNHFQKTITPFGNKEQYQKILNIVTQCETARKRSN